MADTDNGGFPLTREQLSTPVWQVALEQTALFLRAIRAQTDVTRLVAAAPEEYLPLSEEAASPPVSDFDYAHIVLDKAALYGFSFSEEVLVVLRNICAEIVVEPKDMTWLPSPVYRPNVLQGLCVASTGVDGRPATCSAYILLPFMQYHSRFFTGVSLDSAFSVFIAPFAVTFDDGGYDDDALSLKRSCACRRGRS